MKKFFESLIKNIILFFVKVDRFFYHNLNWEHNGLYAWFNREVIIPGNQSAINRERRINNQFGI